MGLIPERVEVGEYTSLRIPIIRGSAKGVFNNGLESSVIEVNNRWRKREVGWGGKEGLIMIPKHTQVAVEQGHFEFIQVRIF